MKGYKKVTKDMKWRSSDEKHLRQGEFKGNKYFEAKWNNVGKDKSGSL